MGERRNSYRVVVERSEGKRLLGKPRRGREYNIKFDLQDIRWGRGLIWFRNATNGRVL
jgi:hypothetical protein